MRQRSTTNSLGERSDGKGLRCPFTPTVIWLLTSGYRKVERMYWFLGHAALLAPPHAQPEHPPAPQLQAAGPTAPAAGIRSQLQPLAAGPDPQVPAGGALPAQLFTNLEDLAWVRATAAARDDGCKLITLPSIKKGSKMDVLNAFPLTVPHLAISSKVDDALQAFKYIPYCALLSAAHLKAVQSDEDMHHAAAQKEQKKDTVEEVRLKCVTSPERPTEVVGVTQPGDCKSEIVYGQTLGQELSGQQLSGKARVSDISLAQQSTIANQVDRVPVSPLALHPHRGGPKNLPIAKALSIL
ncbi:hypothetical protein BKA93DRAFT_751274 [Sparassis latifolia]